MGNAHENVNENVNMDDDIEEDGITIIFKMISGDSLDIRAARNGLIKHSIEKFKKLMNIRKETRVFIYFKGKTLKPESTWNSYEITEGDEVNAIIRLTGC